MLSLWGLYGYWAVTVDFTNILALGKQFELILFREWNSTFGFKCYDLKDHMKWRRKSITIGELKQLIFRYSFVCLRFLVVSNNFWSWANQNDLLLRWIEIIFDDLLISNKELGWIECMVELNCTKHSSFLNNKSDHYYFGTSQPFNRRYA